ncbi:MAG: nucleoside kinase, partial [Alistipes sp.]
MSDIIKVVCENIGDTLEVAMGTTLTAVAQKLSLKNTHPFLAAYVNNRIKELSYKIYTPVTLHFVDITSFEGIRVYQRTAWFTLQKAVRDLYPNRKFYIRHSMGSGFYCEIEGIDEFTRTDADVLHRHMKEIVNQNIPINRTKALTSEVRARYQEQGLDDKVALLDTRPRLYSELYTLDGLAS